MTWTPIPVTHGELPIHGFRVDNVAYITDASAISEDSMTLLEGLEVLVLNALRPNPHYSHFSLPEALEVAQKVNADQTYFTHLSHLMGTHDEVEGKLPAGVHLAHDGLVLTRTSSGTWQAGMSDWVDKTDALMRGLVWLGRLPKWMLSLVAWKITLLALLLGGYRGKVVRANLRRAFRNGPHGNVGRPTHLFSGISPNYLLSRPNCSP